MFLPMQSALILRAPWRDKFDSPIRQGPALRERLLPAFSLIH